MAELDANDAESDSRTASVSHSKRTLPSAPASTSSLNSSPRSTPGRRRKRSKKRSQELQDIVPKGSPFSSHFKLSESDGSNTNPEAPPPLQAQDPTNEEENYDMDAQQTGLGKNRLASGFVRADPTPKSSALRTSSFDSIESGETREDAIRIKDSDEEMESEGGMIVNVENAVNADSARNSEPDSDVIVLEEGEVTAHHSHDSQSEQTVSADNNEQSIPVHLVDLNPDELEEQLKYAFYHLDRSQIDLNRTVVCLNCFGEGHVDCPKMLCHDCGNRHLHSSILCPHRVKCSKCRQRGHDSASCPSDLVNNTVPCDLCGSYSHVEQDCSQRFFVQPQPLEAPLKLWISCSCCASKSHLVGDCQYASRSASARWSLKRLDLSRITNLSLETGTETFEKEAETRGMRPSGLQIKGRADVHQAGGAKSYDSREEEDDQFLRPKITKSGQSVRPQIRLGQHKVQRAEPERRYDRFEAPSYDTTRPSPRDRGSWYGTDSFGRRRSRSPNPEMSAIDRYRPGDRRPPSPRRFDGMSQQDRSYRPPNLQRHPADNWRPQGTSEQAPNHAYRLRSNSNEYSGTPRSNIRMQLPTRQGSNPNLKASKDNSQAGRPPPKKKGKRKNP